jgi:Lrp/AsnC family leucine-responsive transcriptional regulator
MILESLADNAKLTIKELSQQIHLSQTATFERVKKLEREELIRGYFTEINHEKMGFQLTALCHITLEKHQKETIVQFESDVAGFDEIIECLHVSGKHDYILKIIVSDMQEYQKFISEQLSNIKNIRHVESTFVMKTIIKRRNRKII